MMNVSGFLTTCLLVVACPWTLAGDVQLTLTADDLLRLTPATLTVTSGDRIALSLTNSGRLPSHGHRFVLLKKGGDPGSFTSSAPEKDPLPASLLAQTLAHTPLAGPGQTVSVTFPAPAPGSYTYICGYPGHQSMSKGTLIVK